jgi:hypothetical protein
MHSLVNLLKKSNSSFINKNFLAADGYIFMFSLDSKESFLII